MPSKNPKKEECPCCCQLVHPRTVKRHLERFNPMPSGPTRQQRVAIGQPEAGNSLDEPHDNLTEDDMVTNASKDPSPETMSHEDFQDNTMLEQRQLSPDPPVIWRNPPVTVEDWPEPLFDDDNGESDTDDVPADSPDRDPPFVEVDGPPAYHPDNEMEFSDEELQKLLEQHLGSMSEAEWFEL
ncbi:unnamed protein product [Rhizoctonia solani]|uniref:Uncharacterized protein n=1 Tax=Rhizoctonia solani TaxID=456999 RepID=A0A8H3BWK0_9AGAM|nr:unnamed protein product [Rhizoctonia solani]